MNGDQRREAKVRMEEIGRILFEVWDPLDVNDIAPADEYDSYVGRVYSALFSDAPLTEVPEVLKHIETEYMETDISSDERLRMVAERLLAIVSES